MRMMVKLFGYLLFATMIVSLQAFKVKNESQYELRVSVFYTREEQQFMVTPEEIIITWIDKKLQFVDESSEEYTCYFHLKSGQMAEIAMGDYDTEKWHLCIDYPSINSSKGIGRLESEYCHNVEPNDTITFREKANVLHCENRK